LQIIGSSSSSARLGSALAFIERFPPSTELIIVAATRGAADDLARAVTRRRSTFGLHRFSLVELAARAAALDAAAAGRIAGTPTNAEAMAARVTFDAVAAGELEYLGPVAPMPGFPKALARTIHELRLAGLSSHAGRRARPAGPAASALGPADSPGAGLEDDIFRLLARVEAQLETAAVSDRAALFAMATTAWREGLRWFGYPVVLLDVPLNSPAERRFALAVVGHAREACVTCPAGDDATRLAIDAPAM
jgi:hypothetical protein